MKRNSIYLSVFCIVLPIILVCAPILAEGRGGSIGGGGGAGGGRNTDASSILTELSSIKFILGGLAALAGLITHTSENDQNQSKHPDTPDVRRLCALRGAGDHAPAKPAARSGGSGNGSRNWLCDHA